MTKITTVMTRKFTEKEIEVLYSLLHIYDANHHIHGK